MEVFCITKQNKIFDVDSSIYYARDYSGLPGATPNHWWYSCFDGSLICQHELMNQYGYDVPDQITASGVYLPFVQVDMVSLERKYLQQYYPRDILTMNGNDPDASFKRLLECRNGFLHWRDYERNALTKSVIQWCKENKIPYR